ncbi:MAG: hypothetical protein ABJE10_10175 [bacterium]
MSLDPFAGERPQTATFRAHDWSATPLGAEHTWSASLRRSVDHILWSDFPNLLLWGPDLLQLYNESYHELMGNVGPSELGQPIRQSASQDWDLNAPYYARAMAGETVSREDPGVAVTRNGKTERVPLTLSYSPIFTARPVVGGVLITVFEASRAETAERPYSVS